MKLHMWILNFYYIENYIYKLEGLDLKNHLTILCPIFQIFFDIHTDQKTFVGAAMVIIRK